MKPRQRQARILDVVAREGEATVEALSEAFDVSAETIRRDLAQLLNRSACKRWHGGARRCACMPKAFSRNAWPITRRKKRAIAEKVLALVDRATRFSWIPVHDLDRAEALAACRA